MNKNRQKLRGYGKRERLSSKKIKKEKENIIESLIYYKIKKNRCSDSSVVSQKLLPQEMNMTLYSMTFSRLSSLSYLFFFGFLGYLLGCFLYGVIKETFYVLPKSIRNSTAENRVEIQILAMNLKQSSILSVWSKLELEINSRISKLDSFYNHNKTLVNNTVWVVTPTFRRDDQFAQLTRMAQALYPVRHFIRWFIADHIERGTPLNRRKLEAHLKTFPISFILKSSTPIDKTHHYSIANPKGVEARNDALDFIRKNDELVTPDDVIFFADDDNTFDSDIFRQMRQTKFISIWPTGLLTKPSLSSPIVQNCKVTGFFDGWIVNRRFPVDFAMFAINVDLILQNPDVEIPHIGGYIETLFLQIFLLNENGQKDLHLLEPLAQNCTDILTWHTNSASEGYLKKYGIVGGTFWIHQKPKLVLSQVKYLDVLFERYYYNPVRNK